MMTSQPTGTPTLPVIECRRIPDGMPVTAAAAACPWRDLEPVRLVDTVTGAAAIHRTNLRVCWEAAALRVLFVADDPDIWATLDDHDDAIYDEEVVEVFLSPTGDLPHYFELEVSPRNVRFDAKVHSPDLDRATMRVDLAWSCAGWRTVVASNAVIRATRPPAGSVPRGSPGDTWTCELRIPFSAFAPVPPPTPGDTWRANFYRIERCGSDEYQAWSPTLERPANYHVPRRFGSIRFTE